MSPVNLHVEHLVVGSDQLPAGEANPLHAQLPSQAGASDSLHSLGVAWDHLTEALRHGEDLVSVLCTLDELGFTCGRAGLNWFLTRPCSALGWRTPAETLALRGGAAMVTAAIERDLRCSRR